MSTPQSSSNGLLTIICLGILTVCGYKVYQDHFARTPLSEPSKPKATPRKPIEQAIAVSRAIEPLYFDLFSDLNKDNPVDLVPGMSITRERILDKQTGVEEEKKAVYGLAAKLIDGMIVAAEDRTESLEVLLKTTTQPRAALETDRSMTSSNQHFLASQLRRATESLKAKKPALETLFSQLRAKEREWNARLPKNALPENYNIAGIPPAIITLDAEVRQNPLEQRAYDQRRAVHSWRRTYYDRYGYPPNYSY